MLVYRITHKSFSDKLYASGLSGRWNSEGKKVIYCADSIALAFLENMVRRQGVGFNHDFKIMFIEIPDDMKILILDPGALDSGWRNFKDYSTCQPPGDKWFNKQESVILKVPSAILPGCFNFVINTTLPQYKKIKLVQTTDLIPDARIEEILKRFTK